MQAKILFKSDTKFSCVLTLSLLDMIQIWSNSFAPRALSKKNINLSVIKSKYMYVYIYMYTQ